MRIALVFGYGQTAEGFIDAQTADRCNRAAVLVAKDEVYQVWLTASAEQNGLLMAGMMKQYLSGRILRQRIFTDPRGGNTAGEMDVFLDNLMDGEEAVFVSTWYHIPRIIWLASWRLPWKRFSVAVAWKHVHFWGDFMKEFLKLGGSFLRPRASAKTIPLPKL